MPSRKTTKDPIAVLKRKLNKKAKIEKKYNLPTKEKQKYIFKRV